MKINSILLFISICICSQAQPKESQYFFSEAKKAYGDKDFAKFYESINKARELHPYHQSILYYSGLASVLVGKPEEAVVFLKKAILINVDFDLTKSDFNSLQPRKDFQALLKLKTALNLPIVHSQTAFTIKDRQLHTEGIAYDKATGDFFVGSIHKRKIVRISKDGGTSDFTPSAQDGMTSVFGLKIDLNKNLLWACSSPMAEMQNYDSSLSSFVFAYHLSNGKLKTKYSPAVDVNGSVFGDLALDAEGNAFVSDSRNNIIFKANESSRYLEKYFESKEFWNIQGITFSDNGQYLFVADYIKGLFRLNVTTRQLTSLGCDLEISLKGIDGLTFYKNSLIAIQNGVNPLRVTRYYLNADFSKIIRFEIMDRKHPLFNEPTIGIIVGQEFYYIANSQWSGYENGKIKAPEQLQDIVILRAKLN